MNIHTIRFINQLDSALSKKILSYYPRRWKEDLITDGVCEVIRSSLDQKILLGFNHPFNIHTDAFKLSGKSETAHGDIAILININNWDGKFLSGVGLLEAKKRYKGSGKYEKIELSQLERIYRNSNHAQLILYNFERVTEFEDNIPFFSGFGIEDNVLSVSPQFCHSTNAGAMPLNLAIELNDTSTLLHKYTYPLAYQIIGRFFRGYDLHFTKETKNEIQSFHFEQFDINPKYVISIGVGVGVGNEEASIIIPNLDLYTRLG